MIETAMVENHIHHNLQAFLMCLVNESLVLSIGSETRVNLVIIGCGITMIAAALAVAWTVIL